jgi:hypothetical protein
VEDYPKIATYWWQGSPSHRVDNFGDGLNVPLLNHFAHIDAQWASPREADLVCTGSILHSLDSPFRGTVAGAGELYEDTRIDLRFADVRGLRGPLSASQAILRPSQSDYVLGDPGLLASELVEANRDRYRIGVVPHVTDRQLWDIEREKLKQWDPILIDPTLPPLDVVSRIGSCNKVVSSSLHGLVVADSFGIPRRAERFPAMAGPHEGGDWKFRDYGASIGQPVEFGKLQAAPIETIYRIQSELFDMLRGLHV